MISCLRGGVRPCLSPAFLLIRWCPHMVDTRLLDSPLPAVPLLSALVLRPHPLCCGIDPYVLALTPMFCH